MLRLYVHPNIEYTRQNVSGMFWILGTLLTDVMLNLSFFYIFSSIDFVILGAASFCKRFAIIDQFLHNLIKFWRGNPPDCEHLQYLFLTYHWLLYKISVIAECKCRLSSKNIIRNFDHICGKCCIFSSPDDVDESLCLLTFHFRYWMCPTFLVNRRIFNSKIMKLGKIPCIWID